MDNDLKEIAINHKLELLYKNNFYSIKSICEHLGIWDNYSQEEKIALENLTKRDSSLNKNFEYKGKYDKNLIYSEVTRSGVERIIDEIRKYKKDISPNDVIFDIGSGCGKLIIHLSLKMIPKTYVGLEVVEARSKYSKHILEKFTPLEDGKKIFFINKDVRDFDLSIAKIVFINNVTFSDSLNEQIFQKIPSGCHIISFKPLNCKYLKDIFKINVSWTDSEIPFHYYIK